MGKVKPQTRTDGTGKFKNIMWGVGAIAFIALMIVAILVFLSLNELITDITVP